MALSTVIRQRSTILLSQTVRTFSCSRRRHSESYKMVVVGGGTGGCAVAARFCRELGKGNVCVIEPAEIHNYQPMWTLVGAGLKSLSQSQRPMSKVLPPYCVWVKESAAKFDPQNNKVTTTGGREIHYEYMVVATGMQLNYNQIKGLVDALKYDPTVCSNYSPEYVTKTYPALQNIEKGNAIFTFPHPPIKCAGAPQKIMYLAEEIFRDNGKRDQINVIYNTSLGVIFGVKKYADSLLKVIKRRGINVNYRTNLVEVKHDSKEAVFQHLDTKEMSTFKYDFLHAVPPMSAPDAVRASSLVNQDGWVDVNKDTMQHVKYPNVFGIGDCTSAPTSKTAAAAAAQSGILNRNLLCVINGKDLCATYDGYTSCPLITSKNKCILAEFDYNGMPLETFPFDQSQERWTMYQMKAHVMPHLYWNFMLSGYWQGPAVMRKIMHFRDGANKPAPVSS